MTYTLDERTLHCIWEALQEEPLHPIANRQKFYIDKVLKEGWLFLSELTDLVEAMDSRLIGRGLDLQSLSEAFGCHWEVVFYASDIRKKDPYGLTALKSQSTAQFLIMLQRLGFRINTKALVENLYPKNNARTKGLITEAELEVRRFQDNRNTEDSIQLCVNDWFGKVWEASKIITPQGYKIEAKLNKEGLPVHLSATPPKYRKPPKTTVVKCKECDFTYEKGNPEESQAHRKFHKRVIDWLNPKPLPVFLAHRQENPEPELVTFNSPQWKHKQMYERALAFKREFPFDFPQWEDPRHGRNPFAQGFLFSNNEGAIIGACSFVEITRNDMRSWRLDWVWICPKERRKGHLSERWPQFLRRYGDFSVEYPLSPAMETFLKKALPC